MCAKVDSQCLEYLGCITLVSFWNSWSHTDISCCYLLFLGDIWSSQFYASRPRRDFCPFWEVLASRPEKWSAEQNRAEGLKSECLQICSLSWLYVSCFNFYTFSVGGCWGQFRLLFWKLVLIIKISTSQDFKTTFNYNLTCIFLSLRAKLTSSKRISTYKHESDILWYFENIV